MQKSDGMHYAPQGQVRPVVQPGEFTIAAVALEHGHIYGMCNGLCEAGATLKWVWDADPQKVQAFCDRYRQVQVADSLEQILDDEAVQLIASADVPARRSELGIRVMECGKDYFVDKAPMTTLEQLAEARAAAERTGRKYMVYYAERLHVESAVVAGELIEQGRIGRLVQVINLAPHRLNAPSRPDWFWNKADTGGIITDIGSHQIDQFLFYSQASDATVQHARVDNVHTPEHPQFEDYGEVNLLSDNGVSHHLRVDWLTPDGLETWGDGRLFLLGTAGYIEVRKYTDLCRESEGDHLYVVDHDGREMLALQGRRGFPFFGQLIEDCLHRSETAMTQAHAFKVAEVTLKAQQLADANR